MRSESPLRWRDRLELIWIRYWRHLLALFAGLAVGLSITTLVLVIHDNNDRISEVQRSRLNATLLGCYQQDHKHETLFAGLERVAAYQRVHDPTKYRETVKNARQTELLLNAVQPEEDCKERARSLVEETLHGGTPQPFPAVRVPGPLRLLPPER